EIAAHELLRERARALTDLSGAQVDERGAQHAFEIDAVMLVEAPVLDRFQRVDEKRRHVGRLEDQAVLAVHREDAADLQRVEPEERQLVAGRVDDSRDLPPGELDRHAPRRLLLSAVAVGAGHDVERARARAIAPRAIRARGLAIAEASQFGDELAERDGTAGVDLERRREDLRRNVPTARFELAADLDAQQRRVRREADRGREAREQREADEAAEEAAAAGSARSALLARGRLL